MILNPVVTLLLTPSLYLPWIRYTCSHVEVNYTKLHLVIDFSRRFGWPGILTYTKLISNCSYESSYHNSKTKF